MSTLEDRKEDRIYSKVHHTLKGLNRTSPYDSHQLGTLKILDAIVEATDDDNVNKIDATLVLHQHALLALPKNTAEVLRISKGGSGLAIELVRRDLTEFSVLVRALYTSNEEQRTWDEGLHRLYNTLIPVVEVHGALVSAGVDVEQRAWAKALALQIPNLRRLRSTPWHEVALVLKLITLEEEDIEEGSAEGDDSPNMTAELYDSTPWKNPPTRAEIRIVEELYAIGEGAPPIRQQVLGARLGLDVADQLEEMDIFDASTMTQEDARQLTSTAIDQLEKKNKIEKAPLGLKAQGMKPIPDQAMPAPDGSTPRALPALAGIAAKLAPTILKLAPKLAKGSKLTNLTSKSKISGLSNKLNAMASNAGSGGGGGSGGGTSAPGAGGGAGDGLSGLVTTIKQAKKIKELLTPDLEAGVAAVELEKARLQATMDNVRKELDRVSVAGRTEAEIGKAQQALDNAKAAVAPIEGWQNRIASNATETLQSSLQDQRLTLGTAKTTSSYSSNEEIVAKASGGAALYGMNFFPTTTDVVLKPYTPLLATPDFVEMTGAVANFEASVWQSTSVAKAASFHKISEHAGNSVAVQTTTSKGVSGSASTWIGSVSGSSSKEETNETTDTNANENETETSEKTTTSTATVIEYIKCPMKSFRIPMTRMQLSEDARKAALEVKNMRDAEEFLDAYGSHVSNGRQELGGIFFSTITVTSREEVNSEAMMAAASYQSNELKKKSSTKEGGGGGGLFGISAKASASFGKSSSVGKTSVNTSAESKNSEESGLEARYFQYIRCTGPRAPTPETFADALFNDNSSWAVTDRGPIEALVPVTRVLENTMELMEDETEKIRMQSSVNFITAAWRKRAKKWGDVLLDEDTKVNKEVPNVILDLIRTAYPTAQGAVQELINAVYGCLKFADSPTDEDFWGDAKRNQHSEDAAELVAAAILSAAQVATGGNSAPALLSFLDAEDVGVYVQNHMDIKEEENKAAFFAEMKMKPDTKHDDTKHDVSTTLEECWAKLSPLVRFGKHDHDCKASDLVYFESLAPWEQRWIEKEDHFQQNDHRWEAEDWEVFQMEFFKAGVASTFLPELARQLEISFKTANSESQGKGVVVRVVPAGTAEHDKRRDAVNEAASGLNGDDWVLFGKVWTTARHSEETGRVMEIIEDHLVFMKTLYKTPPDSEHIRELTARRDELLDMVRKANMFKEAKVAEVKRTKDTIDAIEVKTDPDTGEEDPVQQRKINKLKLQLEKATKESKFSTEQAVRAGISDKAELDAFDTRFKNSTVDNQLHNGDNGLVQSVINAKRDARNRNRDSYFESKGYFVNPPPATGKLGIGSGPPPPGGFLGLGGGPALPGGLLGFGSSPVV